MSDEVERVLDSHDIGRVFARADGQGEHGEYLLLSSLGTGSHPIASFVTFRLTEGVLQEVGDTGYSNGPWFREVHEFSESFIADVLTRHQKLVADRLRSMKEAAEVEERRNEQLRTRFAKPLSWISVADGRTARKVSEVYGPTDRLLASRSLECSHEPRFGIDALDYDRMFGEHGELSRLVDTVEEGQ